MDKRLLAQLKDAWISLSRTMENEIDTCATSYLIATGKIEGRKIQVQLKFTAEEDDFIRSTNKGVVKL